MQPAADGSYNICSFPRKQRTLIDENRPGLGKMRPGEGKIENFLMDASGVTAHNSNFVTLPVPPIGELLTAASV